MRILAHIEHDIKKYTFRSVVVRRLKLRGQQRTQCETLAKTQDKPMATLWNNDHV